MKITIYELLGLIKDKKIKDGTKIKCSDFPVTYIYKNGTLGFYSQDVFYELTLKDILENIDYANYEIIEEEKEIEKLKIKDGKVIGSWENGSNYNYTLSAPQTVMINKINELIDEINELKSGKDE